MGHDTPFYGKLEFTRQLMTSELVTLISVVNANYVDPFDADRELIEAELDRLHEEERAAQDDTEIHIYEGETRAECVARIRGFIIGDGLSPQFASYLEFTSDFDGLVYRSEKTTDMIGGINFIIVNARQRLPDFGLKGELLADTSFAPWYWLAKIGDDGLAYKKKISSDEFIARLNAPYSPEDDVDQTSNPEPPVVPPSLMRRFGHLFRRLHL